MPTAVDLFCGAGGLSIGFESAGFDTISANDFDSFCAETYKEAHPHVKFVDGPIQDLTVEDFISGTLLERHELDCLIGGPPCQAFSVYNHQRGMHDERSGLFREYLRLVEGLHPRWVVMENVTGMQSVEKGKAVDEITAGLERLGYSVEHRILKAEHYGVPQERRRLLFIANRIGIPIPWPEIITDGVITPFTTIGDAISDLPILQNGEGREEMPYLIPLEECNQFQAQLRRESVAVYNHVAPFLSSVNMERMRHIPPGGSWRDIPPHLLPAGMTRAKRSDHTKRYGRLQMDGLSSTILTKCDIHWGCFIHPIQNRTITVREAARLQSFPDCLIFKGPRTEQYRQVGNAVPPLLAKAVASAIFEAIERDEHGGIEVAI